MFLVILVGTVGFSRVLSDGNLESFSPKRICVPPSHSFGKLSLDRAEALALFLDLVSGRRYSAAYFPLLTVVPFQ